MRRRGLSPYRIPGVQMFRGNSEGWAGRLETKCFHTVTVNSPPASPPSPSPRPPPPGGLSELRLTWAPGRLRSSPGRGAVINASGTRLAAASEPCQQPALRRA